MKRMIIGSVLFTCCSGFFAGCATSAQSTSLVYSPVVDAGRGNGELFLSMDDGQSYEPKVNRQSHFSRHITPVMVRPKSTCATPNKITVVKVNNDRGVTIGKLVMPVYSGDILIDALKQELSTAGYTVRLVHKLRENVEIAIDISQVHADLEQTSGLLTLAGSCNLRFKVDLWRNGTKVGTHDYVSSISDYSFADQDQLLLKLMMEATQNIIVESVPDIIKFISASRK